jgi:hypothetical protein
MAEMLANLRHDNIEGVEVIALEAVDSWSYATMETRVTMSPTLGKGYGSRSATKLGTVPRVTVVSRSAAYALSDRECDLKPFKNKQLVKPSPYTKVRKQMLQTTISYSTIPLIHNSKLNITQNSCHCSCHKHHK